MKRLFLYFGIIASSLCFALVFVLVFINGTAVTCTQQADQTYTCNLQTLLFDQIPTFSHEIDQIVDAETASDGCFEGCAYRTEFITANGSHVPLVDTYSDEGPVDKQTSEISQLLKSGQTSFEYHREPLWWVLYLVGGLFLMEIVMLTFFMGTSAIREYFASQRMPQ